MKDETAPVLFKVKHLAKIAGVKENANMLSIISGLKALGVTSGLYRPHLLAHFIAQIAHESGRFVYDREVWDGKGAQSRYEGRKDLGNTQPGDGERFKGHTAMMITGRQNTTLFRDWLRDRLDDVPDFADQPHLMNTDPWEGLGPIWYWSTRGINKHAGNNNIEMVTRVINGGLNGFSDRLDLYARSALVLLGYEPTDVELFQGAYGLTMDDIAGPITRRAMHEALTELGDLIFDPEKLVEVGLSHVISDHVIQDGAIVGGDANGYSDSERLRLIYDLVRPMFDPEF